MKKHFFVFAVVGAALWIGTAKAEELPRCFAGPTRDDNNAWQQWFAENHCPMSFTVRYTETYSNGGVRQGAGFLTECSGRSIVVQTFRESNISFEAIEWRHTSRQPCSNRQTDSPASHATSASTLNQQQLQQYMAGGASSPAPVASHPQPPPRRPDDQSIKQDFERQVREFRQSIRHFEQSFDEYLSDLRSAVGQGILAPPPPPALYGPPPLPLKQTGECLVAVKSWSDLPRRCYDEQSLSQYEQAVRLSEKASKLWQEAKELWDYEQAVRRNQIHQAEIQRQIDQDRMNSGDSSAAMSSFIQGLAAGMGSAPRQAPSYTAPTPRYAPTAPTYSPPTPRYVPPSGGSSSGCPTAPYRSCTTR